MTPQEIIAKHIEFARSCPEEKAADIAKLAIEDIERSGRWILPWEPTREMVAAGFKEMTDGKADPEKPLGTLKPGDVLLWWQHGYQFPMAIWGTMARAFKAA